MKNFYDSLNIELNKMKQLETKCTNLWFYSRSKETTIKSITWKLYMKCQICSKTLKINILTFHCIILLWFVMVLFQIKILHSRTYNCLILWVKTSITYYTVITTIITQITKLHKLFEFLHNQKTKDYNIPPIL